MSKRIPVSTAKRIAEAENCRQVILLAWDGELTHIVTYGKTADDCAQAAVGGNMLKEKWGWPECNDQPSRVKKLEKQLAERESAALAHREAAPQPAGEFLLAHPDYSTWQNIAPPGIGGIRFSWPQVVKLMHEYAALPVADREGEQDPAMRALESLTPGGSEFVGDVKRCVEYVREALRGCLTRLALCFDARTIYTGAEVQEMLLAAMMSLDRPLPELEAAAEPKRETLTEEVHRVRRELEEAGLKLPEDAIEQLDKIRQEGK